MGRGDGCEEVLRHDRPEAARGQGGGADSGREFPAAGERHHPVGGAGRGRRGRRGGCPAGEPAVAHPREHLLGGVRPEDRPAVDLDSVRRRPCGVVPDEGRGGTGPDADGGSPEGRGAVDEGGEDACGAHREGRGVSRVSADVADGRTDHEGDEAVSGEGPRPDGAARHGAAGGGGEAGDARNTRVDELLPPDDAEDDRVGPRRLDHQEAAGLRGETPVGGRRDPPCSDRDALQDGTATPIRSPHGLVPSRPRKPDALIGPVRFGAADGGGNPASDPTRHYGVYARQVKGRYRNWAECWTMAQSTVEQFTGLEGVRRGFRCPKCGERMVIVHYEPPRPRGEPAFGSRVEDWPVVAP